MDTVSFDQHTEKDRLSTAIATLHEQWGAVDMPMAYRALHRATARADFALTVLEPEEERHGLTFSVHVSGLRILLICAHEEVTRAEAHAFDQLRGYLM
jgi:hypothetical protein